MTSFTGGQIQDMVTLARILERERIPLKVFVDWARDRDAAVLEQRKRDRKLSENAPRHCGRPMRLVGDPDDRNGATWHCRSCRYSFYVEKSPETIVDELTR